MSSFITSNQDNRYDKIVTADMDDEEIEEELYKEGLTSAEIAAVSKNVFRSNLSHPSPDTAPRAVSPPSVEHFLTLSIFPGWSCRSALGRPQRCAISPI